ncbi:MAG: hypothetical protein LBI61_02175 [Puniceicoccales bacterium]|jgi:hypothetical protein|nr:hypothetical protein [Puniceicoccales bacterium]
MEKINKTTNINIGSTPPGKQNIPANDQQNNWITVKNKKSRKPESLISQIPLTHRSVCRGTYTQKSCNKFVDKLNECRDQFYNNFFAVLPTAKPGTHTQAGNALVEKMDLLIAQNLPDRELQTFLSEIKDFEKNYIRNRTFENFQKDEERMAFLSIKGSLDAFKKYIQAQNDIILGIDGDIVSNSRGTMWRLWSSPFSGAGTWGIAFSNRIKHIKSTGGNITLALSNFENSSPLMDRACEVLKYAKRKANYMNGYDLWNAIWEMDGHAPYRATLEELQEQYAYILFKRAMCAMKNDKDLTAGNAIRAAANGYYRYIDTRGMITFYELAYMINEGVITKDQALGKSTQTINVKNGSEMNLHQLTSGMLRLKC